MNHQRAIERVKGFAVDFQLAIADRDAAATLLAAVSHMPVGGDKVPLWAGKMVWTCHVGYLLCWTVIAVEPHGVRLSGSAASNELRKFSEVSSSREAAEEGGGG